MDREQIIFRLREFSEEIRLACLREFASLGFGHIGGCMSIIETLSVLYGHYMNVYPEDPQRPGRDWLVLSKGHAGPALYATLSLLGFISERELMTLNRNGTNLPSHCDRNKTRGVDMTTGSLGQGISTAIGIALGNRLSRHNNYTYLILGDGECDEGQIWEGALAAPQFKLDNLIALCDFNKQQLDGYVNNIMDMGDLAGKWRSFGWHTQEVNGHDINQVYDAIRNAQDFKGTPSMIVLHTIKGHRCSFVEGREFNHHVTFTPEQIEVSINETKAALESIKAQRSGGK